MNVTLCESEAAFNAIKKQKYFNIQKTCHSKKRLFLDPLFPPEKLTTIFLDNKYNGEEIKWVRPYEICNDPVFVNENFTQFDVTQGKLNDCWLITAISIVSMNCDLFSKVVPKGQRFTGQRYNGVFAFNFFIFGEWIQVCVDDLLPTCKGQLIFSRSEEKNEFWPALFEKAYAKISGGYDMLHYGSTNEAFQDITGGVCEKFKCSSNENNKNFFNMLNRYFIRRSLVSCFISDKISRVLPCKLITMHSYGITGLKAIRIGSKTFSLLRLKNPWNRASSEWNGAWSDEAAEWNVIPREIREQNGLIIDNYGEFWIEVSDFLKYFNTFEICHLPLPRKYRERLNYIWNVFQFFGEWSEEKGTAGGSAGNRDTFHENPKYLLTITCDDIEENDEHCTVVLYLEQKLYRIRKSMSSKNLAVGIMIYFYCSLKQKDEGKENRVVELRPDSLDEKFFQYNFSIFRTTYQDTRIICERFRFKRGHYIVIPTTFKQGIESYYMLRVLIARSRTDKMSYEKLFKPCLISTNKKQK